MELSDTVYAKYDAEYTHTPGRHTSLGDVSFTINIGRFFSWKKMIGKKCLVDSCAIIVLPGHFGLISMGSNPKNPTLLYVVGVRPRYRTYCQVLGCRTELFLPVSISYSPPTGSMVALLCNYFSMVDHVLPQNQGLCSSDPPPPFPPARLLQYCYCCTIHCMLPDTMWPF